MEPVLHYFSGFCEGYSCSKCSDYNDILTIRCRHCNSYRDEEYNHIELELATIVRRGLDLILYNVERKEYIMKDEERADLFSKFYAQAGEEIVINNLSYTQLVEWEETLEKIVIEAKAKIRRSTDERNKQKLQMSKEERDRLITNPDMSITDGLTAPKLRQDRMSKADKVAADMAKLGITPDMINQLMGGIVPAKTVVSERVEKENKGFTFNKEENVKPNGNNTQESLLADLLDMVDLNSTNITTLQERYNTAVLLVEKTKSKAMPEKGLKLELRLKELKNGKEESGRKPFDPTSLF